jgi:hypothetical protein
MSETPIYDQLTRDQGWSPALLRPGYDLNVAIAESYMARLRLVARAVVIGRIKTSRKRRQRRGQLP